MLQNYGIQIKEKSKLKRQKNKIIRKTQMRKEGAEDVAPFLSPAYTNNFAFIFLFYFHQINLLK